MIVQYTGLKSPAQDHKGFIKAVREKYSNISTHDLQTFYTRAVMLAQPPSSSRALFGRDILSDDVQSLPWWKYLSNYYRRLILSHPVDSGLKLGNGLVDVKKAISYKGGEQRQGISRSSLISVPGLENSYVWCKMGSWEQDVTPHDLRIIQSATKGKMREFNRSIRVIDNDGPYEYVRPYGNAHVRERYQARTVDEIEALFRDQSRKELFPGFDASKE